MNSQPHIFYGFTFFNEIELLPLKLEELWNINNGNITFIVVESDLTFSGMPKAIYLDLDKYQDMLKPYEDKIYRVLCRNYQGVNPWVNEKRQRDIILKTAATLSRSDRPYLNDILVNADMDEIVSRESVQAWLDGETNHRPTALEMQMYYYYINNKAVSTWCGGKIMKLHEPLGQTLSELRYDPNLPVIAHGGWHFSFLGGAQRIKQKVISYAHNDLYHFVADDVKLAEDLRTGRDIFSDRNLEFNRVEVDETYPKYIRDNLSMWKQFIF